VSNKLCTGGFVDIATKTRHLHSPALLAPLFALALVFGVVQPVAGQTPATQDPPTAQTTPRAQDDDFSRRELANLDRFLDDHPEIGEQLRKDPSLIRNEEFVEKHPALQDYLRDHPGVREQFSEHPNAFMRQEERFDRREDDHGITRSELADMDRFLDSHPEIAEQLRKDPSLIRNEEFVAKHPALQDYLKDHPGVRERFSENPNAFMRHEERFDRREDDRGVRGDRDITRTELAGMDQFLDSHPEIAEQLRKDPSLVNKDGFVEQHPALQEYLKDHPGAREQISEHPNAFMRQEERYDRREDDRDRDHGQPRMGNPDGRGELTSFGQFLGGHSTVAQQLSKDPSLANNKEYLATHPELGEYLKVHPAMTQQLAENPQAVMGSDWVQQGSSTAVKPSNPKAKPNQ
jgi:GrpB-like predicted nucleotidyltransferase (UPF0157 family)